VKLACQGPVHGQKGPRIGGHSGAYARTTPRLLPELALCDLRRFDFSLLQLQEGRKAEKLDGKDPREDIVVRSVAPGIAVPWRCLM
jgi:hypothetical protein